MSAAPSSTSSSQLKVSKLWQLDRYARLLQEGKQLLPHTGPANIQKAASGNSWKHFYSSSECTIQMSLLEDNHLMISNGNRTIYESISLWDAKKWIRGVTKGDTALFIYRMNNENRRFRVKFSPLKSGGSSIDACQQCSAVLSSFMSMSEMQTDASTQQVMEADASQSSFSELTQPSVRDSDVAGNVSRPPAVTGLLSARPKASNSLWSSKKMAVSEIAKAVQAEGKTLGEAYASTNFPTEQLGPFVRLCLTDANFPGFVEAVEKELNIVTTPH